ncbi:alpha/beta hydrolase [Pontixanthobacter gangjinensis]|uniref:Alpha/beta hydrolase n=1 Tax=Christiangramia aestuarii TaxID=1028746 RepID=A0A7M3SXN7_9FLAO|nr:alpha/beta hydrolase [Christiangramia aestuarii]MUP41368.1 alpha/beta hydrolase [Christiangramia aestuarii]
MRNILFAFLILLISQGSFAQEEYMEEDLKIDQFTEGTLTSPTTGEAKSLVIFVQGSGPTDRNGNQALMKNDGMKKIARELAANGIASYRFDKRIFKMNELNIKEEDLRFEDLVNDVEKILNYFEERDTYNELVIAGHSQGSLVGMLAAREKADAYISLAGAAQPIDNVIVEQIDKMAPQLTENARTAFNEIRENGQTTNYSPMLENIFKPSVQPYMQSWMKYDPAEEIEKLDIPVLIINGTSDIQVEVKEAEMLKNAGPDSRLEIVENMNHIFREIKTDDRLVNTKSYNEPNLPLHPQLIPIITDFIKELE